MQRFSTAAPEKSDAVDAESRNFKSYQQVSQTWSKCISTGVLIAIVLAIIALIIGGMALEKASEDSSEALVPTRTNNVATNTATNSDSVGGEAGADSDNTDSSKTVEIASEKNAETDRALPGSVNYSGYHPAAETPVRYHFEVVTHGRPEDDYFYYLQKGIDDAGALFKVDISYVDPETDDDAANDAIIVENIKNARNRLKDGMAVSFLEHNSEIGKALREASYDMPVLSMLMDQDVYDGIDVSTLANLGFSNVIAGTIAGEEFKSQGVKSALCLLNDRRVYGHLDICKTFFKVAEVEDQDIKTVNAEDNDLMRSTVQKAIDDGVQSIFTLSRTNFDTAYSVLKENDKLCSRAAADSCVYLATLDESEEILKAIVDGSVGFALDSQQYLQGYMAIHYLDIYKRTTEVPGANRTTLTGPIMIDEAEAKRRLKRDIMAGKSIDDKTASDLDIRFIVHGKGSDPFWNQVKNGVRSATRSFKMDVDFRHVDSELVNMDAIVAAQSEQILLAADENVDALVISLPTNDSKLIDAVNEAYSRNPIPIYTIAAGHRWFESLPIRAHIGLTEFFDGLSIADKLSEVNVERVLCVIYEKGNEDLEELCHTIGSTAIGIEVEILDSTETDNFHADMPNRENVVRSAVLDRLGQEPKIHAIVSTGVLVTEPIRNALVELDIFCKDSNQPNQEIPCIEFVAFGLSTEVFTYIKNDELLFAVDGQPYLQGYLPVVFSVIDVLWANYPYGIVHTGPKFVDSSNVEISEIIYGFSTL